MGKNQIFMEYDNMYFNNAMQCVFCNRTFESGGIQFGIDVTREDAKLTRGSAICPDCMKKGAESWKEMLRARAQELKGIDWDKRKREAERQADKLESLAEAGFALPSKEEQEAIRGEYPGEWPLHETEQRPDGSRVLHVLSAQGERTGEDVTIPALPDGVARVSLGLLSGDPAATDGNDEPIPF